ncbi:hypothetical protein BCR36DRAFT_106297 [Piromyces finnis]|uniref:N-acetyltransferase domain-containing protein n=1 Tax=Piromyces finnis TaxID=1754191 RepID=A0A1Y1V4R0_9FUNG|nr:hypothetical protein BCR36DRAFT_106297 [Piromyces finnis]|eukprot:ORX45939.1 hypothetical protein BCR36DRAFT_106297 [Piromyces finnis]
MSNISYRVATKKDFDECLEVVYSAFKEYSVYQIWKTSSEKKQQKFNKAIMSVQLYDAMTNDTVMVAERDNKIICVSMIQDEKHKEPSVPRYFLYGALSILINGGFKNTFGFLDMMDHCNAPRLEYAKTNPCFNLECIAVMKECIGQNIGSRMINECVIPFVKKRGGQHLTLITNSEKNTFFYKKNGFEIYHHDTLTYNNKNLKNWIFKLDIN